jgi:hypothetical protein
VQDNGPAAETQKMKTASFSADFMALRPICRSLSCSAVPISRLLWKVANSNLGLVQIKNFSLKTIASNLAAHA